MTPTGSEHPRQSSEKTVANRGAAHDAAHDAAHGGDAGLQAVIEAWPTLPAKVRAQILTLIGSTR